MNNTNQDLTIQATPNPHTEDLVAALIPTILLVLFLFFIDEGYYDFRWMADWGNWIVFVLYLVALYPLQFLVARFLFGSQKGVRKKLLVCLTGVSLTLLVLFVVVAII